MSDSQMSYYPPPPPPGMPTLPPAKPSNGLATAGFVVGLLGFLGSFIPVLNIGGIVLGIVGAILAGVGLAKAGKVGAGKGLALAGLILGVLAVIIAIVINVVFAKAVSDAVDKSTKTSVSGPAASGGAAAPAGTATAAGPGATRDNPAPIGSAITGGDWAVKVNSVTTVDKDSAGQAPASGKTLLVVNVTATYSGSDSQGATPWASVKFVTADGTTIDGLDGSTLFIPDNQFDSMTTVYQGAAVTGNKMIEVPADGWDKGVLAVSPDLMSDDTFVAVK